MHKVDIDIFKFKDCTFDACIGLINDNVAQFLPKNDSAQENP